MSIVEEEKIVAMVNPDDYQDPLLKYYAERLNIELKPKGFSPRELLNKLLGKTHDGLDRDKIPSCQNYRRLKQSV